MAISKEWWARWWQDDWSWDGWTVQRDGTLVETGEGVEGRDATLQDYWRDQENDLISSPGGKLEFTRIHLPFRWPNDNVTGKANWDDGALSSIITAKLAAAKDTTFEPWGALIGADRRAQFQGTVFERFSLSELTHQSRGQDDKIPVSIRCDKAAFAGDTSFRSAAFAGDAGFGSAAFAGNADFQSAAFAGNADFERAAFAGNAYFFNAAFAGNAYFFNAAFAGDANFQSAAFARDAYFQEAAFAGAAYFQSAAFASDANFLSAAFAGNADFQSAAFAGDADFESAAFAGNADFESTVFEGKAVFSGQGNSVIAEAVVADLVLSEAGAARVGRFEQAETVNWTARRSFPEVNFEGAVFMDAAKFDNRDFHSDTSFNGVVFLREAVFHNSLLHRGISFTQTNFELALEPSEFAPGNVPGLAQDRMFEAAVQTAKAKGETALPRDEWAVAFAAKCAETNAEFETQDVSDKNTYFESLEDAFRTLKQIMEERRNRGQEANFFKLELQARRHRRDKEFVPKWERLLSDEYERFSDFGTSIMLPIVWLLGGIFGFALLYMFMGDWFAHTPSAASFFDALSFSLGRVLPFGPWAEPEPCSALGQMMQLPITGGGTCGEQTRAFWGWASGGVRILASLQSLLALVLVFLSGLAVRRRFQIN